MGGADELDAALGDGPGGFSFQAGAYFVDNDDLGHVVFHGFYHNCMLHGRCRHLQPPGMAYGGMWYVTVAGDFIGGVDDDDALFEVVGHDSSHLAQHCCLADAGSAEEEHTFARLNEVVYDFHRAEHSSADAAGQADDASFTVAHGRDAVQRALDAGSVIAAEAADAGDYVLYIRVCGLGGTESYFLVGIAGFGGT